MNAIPKCLAAAAALAFATPALAWTVYPDVDFEWYANVGRPIAYTPQAYPAPRAGFIWSPARYDWTGSRQVLVPGTWIVDDYDPQWRAYAIGGTTVIASDGLVLRDRDGNVIPIDPAAYPIR